MAWYDSITDFNQTLSEALSFDVTGSRASNKIRREQEAAALSYQQRMISAAMIRPSLTEEPFKAATDRVQGAKADTQHQQLLRRGLMATFTRYPSTASGSVAGKASKLGGA